MSSTAEIDELKTDIAQIKAANPNWASDAGDKAAIAAKDNRIAGLEARLTQAPAAAGPAVGAESRLQKIKNFLKGCGITRPDVIVMQRIGRSERLLDIGSMDAEMAERLYRQLKDEVGTETKSFIGESLGMRINGAVFEDFPFILSAMEGRTAKLVKILRVVDGAGPLEDRELDVSYEIASADFTHSSIVPMVHRIVSIDQETAVRAHCKVGENNVLVMPWYHGSLNKHPSRCLNWIADEGTKLLDALRYLHDEKNFVHMDVKAMNVFVDKDGHWLLGDFGSCKPVGEIITSCTSLFYFEDPNGSVAHPKYDYFMFLVMLLIEALPDRRTFHREFYDNTDSRHCSKQKVLTMAKSLASAGDSKAFETLLGQVLGNLSQCDVK